MIHEIMTGIGFTYLVLHVPNHCDSWSFCLDFDFDFLFENMTNIRNIVYKIVRNIMLGI